jgi:hypothetical protein
MLGFDELAVLASVTYFYLIEQLIIANWLGRSMDFFLLGEEQDIIK